MTGKGGGLMFAHVHCSLHSWIPSVQIYITFKSHATDCNLREVVNVAFA